MDRERQDQIDAIWAVLHAMVDRENAAERQSQERMARLERQMRAPRKRVEAGMKMVIADRQAIREIRLAQKEAAADTRELKRAYIAFLRSFQGGNGGANGKKK